MTDPRNERRWEPGWDGHERAQLIRMSRLTLDEKLVWLEEAHRLIREIQVVREKAPEDR